MSAAIKLWRFYHEVQLDHRRARKWLILAAEHGDPVSQYNLGLEYSGELYPNERDLAKAKHWFRMAAQNGDKEAACRLKELEN